MGILFFTLFLTKEARKYNGAKTASSINGDGINGQLHVKKNEIRTSLTPKINSKWINDIKVQPETIKVLEEHRQNTR